MRHLYYCRHGQSEMNATRRWAGHTETPLTSLGRQQAIAAGKKAKQEGLKFDLIIASPLSRAYETAKLIAKEVGYPTSKIERQDFLKERYFGDIENTLYELQDIDDPTKINFLDHINNVEKVADLYQRARDAFAYIQSLKADNILIVSHGAFGRMMTKVAKNIPLIDYGERLENGKIYQLI